FDSARAVWIGDSVSIATVVPVAMFVVSLLRGRRRPPSLPTNRLARVELALQVVALVAAPVLGVWMAERQSATGFLTVAVLPVIWVAMRGDLVTAAVGLLVANVSLTWAAATWLESTASMAELQTVMLAS